jgi:internalin A
LSPGAARQFPKLRVLELTNSQITDAGLAELAELKNLEEIQLYAAQTIKGDGFKHLVGNKNLKILHIDIGQINDAAVRTLRKAGLFHTLYQSFKGGDKRPASDDEVRFLAFAEGVTDTGLEELVGLPALQSLHLWGPNVTNRSMAILGKMPKLRELAMRGARITDAGLKEIAHLKDLEVLLIDDAPITDEGLKIIGGFKSLKTLYLRSQHIKGEGFRHLAGLPLKELFLGKAITDDYIRVLRETNLLHCLEAWNSIRQPVRSAKEIYALDLSYTQITAAGLKELKDLPNLRILHLRGTRIKGEEFVNLSGVPSLEVVVFDVDMVTDEALRTLRKHDLLYLLATEARRSDEPLKTVRAMRLAGQPITDEGLKVLREVASLTELDLSGTSVSDVGVKELKEMPALEHLNLRDTRVTNKGLASLLENKKLKRIDVAAKLVDDETLTLFHKAGRLEVLSNTRCEIGEEPSSANVVGIVLNNTQVTDEGLKLLKDYPKLEFINIRKSRVTDAGVAELLKTFPKLHVLR